MRSPYPSSSRVVALLVAALSLWIAGAAPAHAQESNDGPAFLILSADGNLTPPTLCECEFCEGEGCGECGESGYEICDPGSPTITAKIGTCVAGPDILSARYVSDNLQELPVPEEGFEGSGATILGSFKETDEDQTVHLVTPVPPFDPDTETGIPIPPEVQEAFFNASVALTDAVGEQGSLGPFPTAGDLAQFVYENQAGAGADLQDIADAMFTTSTSLNDLEPTLVEGEGDLYPHNPDKEILTFEFSFDPSTGDFTSYVATPVEIDIKPGNSRNVINYKSKGVVWAAILTTSTADGDDRDFDAPDEVDPSTVYLGGAKAKQYKVQDVDHDGDKDLTLKFDVADIGLDKCTTEVELTGQTDIGASIVGSDAVTVVPKGKK